jgi:hypothetical protein
MAFSLHYHIYLTRKTPEGEILDGTLNSSLKKEKGPLGTQEVLFPFINMKSHRIPEMFPWGDPSTWAPGGPKYTLYTH